MALNVVFWTAVALLYAAQWALRQSLRDPTALAHLVLTQLVSFAPCALLTPVVAMITVRHPLLGARRARTLLVHAAALVGFVVVGGAMMGALEWILPWTNSHPSMLVAAGRAIYFYLAPDTLFYVLVAAFVSAVTHARESNARSIDQARLGARLAEAQLNVLSMQLQPHFLFNTLHAISALVREDPRLAERLIARVSELLRYSLESTDRGTVSLDEEFAMVAKYVEIQRARYGARLAVRCELDPDARDVPLPPFLLQPLVENAIRHGIAPRPAGGTVTIGAKRDGDVVHLRVDDDGVGLPRGGMPLDGIGLASTRARLDQLYGTAYTLTLAAREGGGTSCRIALTAPAAASVRANRDVALDAPSPRARATAAGG